MANYSVPLSELRELPEDQHLFCPRIGEDGSVYYDEDVAAYPLETDPTELAHRKLKLQEAEDRKWAALKATEILAFDDDDAAPHKEWLASRLNQLMQSCDVCVRVFHQSRAEWQSRLLDTYDEENVRIFMERMDTQCLGRIQKGLDEANEILGKAEPKSRSVRLLPNECTYGFFEALSCDALIRNEELLQRHFDAPFDMVQTKKRLKVQTYLPAMTRFLFSRVERRHKWATESWSTFKRNLLKSEWDWAVRDYITSVMMKVQMYGLDKDLVPLFWGGSRLIVAKMDRELITDSLRALDGDFYRLMLDHLSLPSEGFLDLIATMKQLLETSPIDYWDGMNAVTPSIATVVEQVFNSPVFNQLLLAAADENEQSIANLHAAFSWIPPFLDSIKLSNLGPAIRPFAQALLGRFQSDHYPATSRAYCYREGLKVLDYAFRKMGEGKSTDKFVGQPVVNGMLDMLSTFIQSLVMNLNHCKSSKNSQDMQLALSVIEHAFKLEAHSLIIERNLISAKQPSPTETPPSSPIWKTVLRAIGPGSLELATHLLIAGRTLIGLEPLQMKSGVDKVPATVRHFNNRFELLSQSITDVVEKLSEYDPSLLRALFGQRPAASAIISLMFSSVEYTRLSARELLKVISGEEERRGALQHMLRAHYRNMVLGISDSIRQVRLKRAFAPVPDMIRTCSDIIDIICNSQDGILRSQEYESGDAAATMSLWENLWDSLTMIFATTEGWSNLGFYDKRMMMDFCRDTMQFADMLFDQYSLFATVLQPPTPDEDGSTSKTMLLKELLARPANAMEGLAKWLRLRDEFLSSKSVTLISKLLVRLRRVSIDIDADALSYMERVLSGDVRAKLSKIQQAELQQALEEHLGRTLVKEEEPMKPKQASISKWMSPGVTPTPGHAKANLMASMTAGAAKFQERREQTKTSATKAAQQKAADDIKSAQQAEFKRKRLQEKERTERERAAIVAKAKAARGLSSHTAEAGSGLEGLGVLGKEQAAKGEGLMHSSDESSNEEGDIDEDMFGSKGTKIKTGPKTNMINQLSFQMPTKKRRRVQSGKSMLARIAPDLSGLHVTILGWNYFYDGDFPPKTSKGDYSGVISTFHTPVDYQRTFERLLILEAWQSFIKMRDEPLAKPYEIQISSQARVDQFSEVGTTLKYSVSKEMPFFEGDIILLSQSKPSADEPACLARVSNVKRTKAHFEITYRLMPGGQLQNVFHKNNTLLATKIDSITSLEREFAALKGLQYYDLCDEIIKAKPSPLLTYKDSQIQPLISNYNVNMAQGKAIKSAIDNDGFTLIQGPPGSGKTKTITAIVGAILSGSFRNRGTNIAVPGQPQSDAAPKKILVCAPSNAAVDELCMRFRQGIKTLNGEERQISIVRLGRSEAVKASIQDLTLDELVDKRLGAEKRSDADSNGNEQEARQKVFSEHQETSKQLREAYDLRNKGEVKGEAAAKLDNDISALYRKKKELSGQIDAIKDNQAATGRKADARRDKAIAAILNDAHVVCSTLSGSGHNMFRTIEVEFDTVIVDEAAQCVEMSALIPLKYGCAKCILVGDPKQLPPTIFSKEAARFRYAQSLFMRMQQNHPNDVHLLDTQYRMHPEISLFPSQTFYDGKLLDGGDMASLRKQPWHQSSLLGPYRFFDVKGQQQKAPSGKSLMNIAEINVALQLYNRLTSDYPDYNFKGKIGIITPYKSQLQEIKQRFMKAYGQTIIEDIDFNTTDAFQGRESEIIIFSCVRANGGIGFLDDVRRMNVGLTRAKSSLWVLGNSASLQSGEFWNKLIVNAQARKRFTDGDISKMLNQHSSKFPAPKEGYVQANRPMPDVKPEVQSEPMSRSASNQPNTSMKEVKKEEIKIKTEMTLVHHEKRKFEQQSNGVDDIKRESSDVEMEDAASESAPNTTNGGSGRSTPAAQADATRKGSTPGLEGSDGTTGAPAAITGDVIGGMSMAKGPKIRRRPRPPQDPFIKNKKPKSG
ncbi:Superfamily I DNA and RNA helicase and helicase protein [Pyrenophora teres f. maculata]|nr:Superfamily I DNA and RNA helicase and helicase protein [Pyrenophora teres f. maculata]